MALKRAVKKVEPKGVKKEESKPVNTTKAMKETKVEEPKVEAKSTTTKASGKGKKKESAVPEKEDPKEIEKLLKEALAEKSKVEEKITDLYTRKLYHDFYPFREGDKVLMSVKFGKNAKECVCVLSIDKSYTSAFRATPIKEDGTLSNRSFIVYRPEDIKSI